MDTHERRLTIRNIAERVGEVFFAVDDRPVCVCRELAERRWNLCVSEVLHQFFAPSPISNQVGDGDQFQSMLISELAAF